MRFGGSPRVTDAEVEHRAAVLNGSLLWPLDAGVVAGVVKSVNGHYRVLDVGPLAVRSLQRVIGSPERQRREQLFPEAIPGKRARLADQATNDVAVIDPVVRRTPQPRHRAQHPAAVEHLDRRRMLPRLDRVADQPRRHRVDPAADPNRAPLAHPALERRVLGDASRPRPSSTSA